MNLTDGQLRHRLSTSAVLEFAWDAGAFRADHVMAALGLTRSTALAAGATLGAALDAAFDCDPEFDFAANLQQWLASEIFVRIAH